MKRIAIIFSMIAVLFAGILAPVTTAQAAEDKKVKIAVVGEMWEEIWKEVAKDAKKEGIDLEVVLMNDYVLPNQALNDGSVDMNAFQHINFLNNWNKENKAELTPIGYTIVTPLYIFSDKIKDLKDLPEKGTVIIPQEPAIQGRALLALQMADVIKLKDGGNSGSTVKDIVENPKNIQFKEVESAQAPRMLPDVDAASLSGNFAADSGIPVKDAIFSDADHIDKIPEEQKNVVVVRKEDRDNATYKRIVELFQTDKTKETIEKVSKGQYIPIW